MAWIGYAQNDGAKTVLPVAQAGPEDGHIEALRTTWADTDEGQGPAGVATLVPQNWQRWS